MLGVDKSLFYRFVPNSCRLTKLAENIGNYALRMMDAAFRARTAVWRCLPDTIIVGAQKAGTSSLFRYLIQHPDILASSKKEVHFFDGGIDPEIDNFKKGMIWYRAYFPFRTKTNAQKRILEASPLYLFNPDAANRIHCHLPSAKIVVILRNPVERAISHYFHEVRAGREGRPIMRALVEEDSILDPVWANREFKNDVFIRNSYKARGMYAKQVARYFDLFSEDQVFVMGSKSLFDDPDSAIKPLLSFLDVDADFTIPDKRARNPGMRRPQIEAEVSEYLTEFFAPHNNDLFQLLRKELNW